MLPPSGSSGLVPVPHHGPRSNPPMAELLNDIIGHRIRKMAMKLAVSMPPMTPVPMTWRATAPAPEAIASGTQPG